MKVKVIEEIRTVTPWIRTETEFVGSPLEVELHIYKRAQEFYDLLGKQCGGVYSTGPLTASDHPWSAFIIAIKGSSSIGFTVEDED